MGERERERERGRGRGEGGVGEEKGVLKVFITVPLLRLQAFVHDMVMKDVGWMRPFSLVLVPLRSACYLSLWLQSTKGK